MLELHETLMGRKLIEGTFPRIAEALEEIARQLKIANGIKNKEEEEEKAIVTTTYTDSDYPF